ncbi:MAG: tetratricopeptide repeat protein [Ignavibacteriales bacterium]|nr:tetratricopeptide repeat protein [Ignavibacteriales bacterium]
MAFNLFKAKEAAPEKQLLAEGIEHYQKDNYQAALTIFDKLLQGYPNAVEVLWHRGLCYKQLMKFEEAVNDFNAFIKKSETVPAIVFYARGLCKKHLQGYEEALVDISKYIAAKPEAADAYYHRAFCYYQAKDYDKADADLSTVISKNPNLYQAHSLSGQIRFEKHEYEKAIQDFNNSINMQPDDFDSWLYRGKAKLALNLLQEALHDFQKSMLLSPENEEIYYNLGVLHQKLGSLKDALESLNKAITINPNSIAALEQRANVYSLMEQYEQVLEDYSRILEISPQLTYILERRSKLNKVLNRIADAKNDLYTILEYNPPESSPYFSLAELEFSDGKYDKALEMYNKAIEREEGNHIYLTARGKCFVKLGQPSNGIRDYIACIPLAPENQHLYYLCALARIEQLDYNGAMIDLTKALTQSEFIDGYFARGDLKIRMDDYNSAIIDYDRITKLDSGNKVAYFMKAFCYDRLDKGDDALREANKALKCDPKYGDALYIRALTNFHLFNNTASRADCELALQVGSDNYQTELEGLYNELMKKITRH